MKAFWCLKEWKNWFFKSTILLTGGTGFLGAHLLYQILNATQVSVYYLNYLFFF